MHRDNLSFSLASLLKLKFHHHFIVSLQIQIVAFVLPLLLPLYLIMSEMFALSFNNHSSNAGAEWQNCLE